MISTITCELLKHWISRQKNERLYNKLERIIQFVITACSRQCSSFALEMLGKATKTFNMEAVPCPRLEPRNVRKHVRRLTAELQGCNFKTGRNSFFRNHFLILYCHLSRHLSNAVDTASLKIDGPPKNWADLAASNGVARQKIIVQHGHNYTEVFADPFV